MAASSPKKAPTKKAAEVPENLINFDEFRQRARDVREPKAHDVEPYKVGPVQAVWPTDLKHEVALLNATRAMNNGTDEFAFLDILRILFGDAGFRFLLDKFNDQPDKYKLLIGLVRKVTDHFQGQGAARVPGGSPAS